MTSSVGFLIDTYHKGIQRGRILLYQLLQLEDMEFTERLPFIVLFLKLVDMILTILSLFLQGLFCLTVH